MADDEVKPKASITNIYYDCLERIFEFLGLESLLNVANTCKRLQIAAAARFGDEHGEKIVDFCQYSNYCDIKGIYVDGDSILTVGLKFQLSFLRCFGSKISHLKLSGCTMAYEHKIIVQQYINQYCGDTLTSLNLFDQPEFSVEKPFKNLEKLVIYSDDFEAELLSFVNWYPNLRHLELWTTHINSNCTAVNFPHLESFKISMNHRTINSVTDLLNANLQLQSFDIYVFNSNERATNLTMILNMIHAHQSISKFVVEFSADIHVTTAELLQLANEHPSMAELNLIRCQLKVDDALAFIPQLNSLKKFEFCYVNESECDRIRDQLKDEWQFDYDGYTIELIRKVKQQIVDVN